MQSQPPSMPDVGGVDRSAVPPVVEEVVQIPKRKEGKTVQRLCWNHYPSCLSRLEMEYTQGVRSGKKSEKHHEKIKDDMIQLFKSADRPDLSSLVTVMKVAEWFRRREKIEKLDDDDGTVPHKKTPKTTKKHRRTARSRLRYKGPPGPGKENLTARARGIHMSEFLANTSSQQKKISEQQEACGAEWNKIKSDRPRFEQYLSKAREELDAPVSEEELRKLLREFNSIVKEQATHLLQLVPGNKFVYSFSIGERSPDGKTKLLTHCASEFPQFNPVIVANPGSATFEGSSSDETMAMAEESTQVALQAVAAVQAKKAYSKLQKEYERATLASARQAILLLGNARSEGQKFVQENSQGANESMGEVSSSSSSAPTPPTAASSSSSSSVFAVASAIAGEINLDAVIEAAEEAKHAAGQKRKAEQQQEAGPVLKKAREDEEPLPVAPSV